MNDFEITEEKLLQVHDVNWPALLSTVLQEGPPNMHLAGAHAYMYARTDDEFGRQAFEEKTKMGQFESVFHFKDTDAFMAADVVYFGMKELANEDVGTLTVVLVTGDIDFSQAVKRLKEFAGEKGKSVNFWFISWKKSLNSRWWNKGHKVTFVDNLAHVLSPTARTRVEEQKEKMQTVKKLLRGLTKK